MTVMTFDVIQKQPAALRGLVCKYLAQPRWQDTCDFYNQMMERERLTVCFHAQLKQRHSVMRLEEMEEADRERIVCALDELRFAFTRLRQLGVTKTTFIRRLTVSQRRSLFLHAGLTEHEFMMPHWRLEEKLLLA